MRGIQGLPTLRFGHNLPDCTTHPADDCLNQIRRQHTNGTSSQEVPVDRRDLLAEDDAVLAQTASASTQGHASRTQVPPGEDRHYNQVITHPISNVLRNHHGRTRLMRIIRLTRGEDVPDLAAPRSTL